MALPEGQKVTLRTHTRKKKVDEVTEQAEKLKITYLKIKEKHLDEILFYRMGDFYEMFFNDAVLAS